MNKIKFVLLNSISKFRKYIFGPYSRAVIYETENGLLALSIDDFTIGRKLGFQGKWDMYEVGFLKNILILSLIHIYYEKIKKIAGKNIEFLGFAPKQELIKYMQGAKAFVFAAEEDFGITPIEAQACGVPVIAFGKGGALETIKGKLYSENNISKEDTGIFFPRQDISSIIEAVNYFEKHQHIFDKQIIRENSLTFDTKNFEKNIKEKVDNIIANHKF